MREKELSLENLHHEDCLVTMARLQDGRIDMILTSPPYDNIRDYKDNAPAFEFKKIAHELYRILKPGGVLVWIVGDQVVKGNESGTSMRQALYFKDEVGFNLFDTIIFQKTARPNGAKNGYWQAFEYMFVLSKGGPPATINLIRDRKNNTETNKMVLTNRNKAGKLVKHTSPGFGEYGRRTNVWKYSTGYRKTTSDEVAFQHPAIMHEGVAQDHIRSWSNPDDMIYDPFMGSGTTAKMAEINDRYWFGSEISLDYCLITQDRIMALLI